MKRFSIPGQVLVQALVHTFVIALVLNSCAPQAVATANPIDLPGTIVAAGSTVIAQTQAAIPTATPTATATDTPAFTLTSPVMPTLVGTITPGGNSGAGDPCIYKVLPDSLEGKTIRLRMDNPVKAKLNVSVYLQQNGPQTICGYRSYTVDPQGSLVINGLVEGCYTLWAWNPDPDDYFMVTNGTNCLDDSRTWQFDISTSSIKLRP